MVNKNIKRSPFKDANTVAWRKSHLDVWHSERTAKNVDAATNLRGYKNNNDPLTAVLSVSMTVIPNSCFYRWVLWVWCHIMTSWREKLMCKFARLLIGQFVFTLVGHMISACFDWIWLVNSGHMTKTNLRGYSEVTADWHWRRLTEKGINWSMRHSRAMMRPRHYYQENSTQ